LIFNGAQSFSDEMRQHAFNRLQQWRMGQTTRSQGISFTYEMWARIETRASALRLGRSQYFQMLVENDLRLMPDIHAHKADGKWHLYPEGSRPAEPQLLKAAEEAPQAPVSGKTKRRRR
jgi:hypothetical protein